LVPVFCGSAALNFGVKTLMDSIIEFMPSPIDSGVIKAKKSGKDEICELKTSEDAPLSALVFKTIADPFVGKIR